MNEHSDDEATLDLLRRHADREVTLVNLIKFKLEAAYPSKPDLPSCSGSSAYGRYMEVAQNVLADIGARILIDTVPHPIGILNAYAEWDRVIVVAYPSAQTFLSMIELPHYTRALEHRAAAIERNVSFCAIGS